MKFSRNFFVVCLIGIAYLYTRIIEPDSAITTVISMVTPLGILIIFINYVWSSRNETVSIRGMRTNLRMFTVLSLLFTSTLIIAISVHLLETYIDRIPSIPQNVIEDSIASYLTLHPSVTAIQIEIDQDNQLVEMYISGLLSHSEINQHATDFTRYIASAAARSKEFDKGPLNDYYGSLWDKYQLTLYIGDQNRYLKTAVMTGPFGFHWHEVPLELPTRFRQ